jgi:hypothetical protein
MTIYPYAVGSTLEYRFGAQGKTAYHLALLGRRRAPQLSNFIYIYKRLTQLPLKGLGHEIRIALKWYGLTGLG